jgi:glycine/D-amino acid oxidase-like deaminating enzyme
MTATTQALPIWQVPPPAAAGLETLVLDAGAIGAGCSGRNGGQVAYSLQPSLATRWVAYTFDTLPHLGVHDGLYYCVGYCGQGVPLAPYFGMRIGQPMAGLAEGRTALDRHGR